MGINHSVGAPLGNQRAKMAGPKRKILSYRIREDYADEIDKIAAERGVKPGLIADEAYAAYLSALGRLPDSAKGNEIKS